MACSFHSMEPEIEENHSCNTTLRGVSSVASAVSGHFGLLIICLG
jgi:hypothetical protein